MATAAEMLPETGTDLIVAEAQRNAVALFTNEQQYDEFYRRVRDSVAGFVPDVTTDKGRREIASVAFRVTKAKTTLDKAGLALTEEWRQKTNAVNAARKKMTTQLDALADEVRKPLTEWEAKEAERQARVDRAIAYFRDQAVVHEDETADDVANRSQSVGAVALDPELFQVRLQEAADAKDATLQALSRSIARLRQEEADRRELERLRQEAAEREERERQEREARETAERERLAQEAREREAREAEERRKAEIAAAEERARREAEERARAEERRVAEEAIAEERRAREAAEREAAERRRADEERAAWEAKERREREAREADDRHRKAVLAEVTEDIAAALFNAPEKTDVAQALANAIAASAIRHVRVEF